jgi:hypothetical protein
VYFVHGQEGKGKASWWIWFQEFAGSSYFGVAESSPSNCCGTKSVIVATQSPCRFQEYAKCPWQSPVDNKYTTAPTIDSIRATQGYLTRTTISRILWTPRTTTACWIRSSNTKWHGFYW